MIRNVRAVGIIFLVAFVAGATLLVRLGGQERRGPAHTNVVIDDGIPATFYVPGALDRDEQELPDPLTEGRRPPVIVLAHGFSADRALMSTLARSLTAHGYAVLAFDFSGHGSSRRNFSEGALRDEVGDVVTYLETSPWVDPDRIVVMGHSMGASAVLEFATQDPRPAAVVAISGGDVVDGPYRPRNVLFIAAENDPGTILDSQTRLANRLAGGPMNADVTVGDRDSGTAVHRTVIPGRDHLTILWDGEAVNRMVRWMDGLFGIERAQPRGIVDGRLGTASLYLLAMLVLLAGIGRVVGKAAPRVEPAPSQGALGRLLLLAAALLATAPFLALTSPAGFLRVAAGDNTLAAFALAGGALLVVRWLAARDLIPALPGAWVAADRPLVTDVQRVAVSGFLGFVAVYVVFSPLGPIFHQLVPTPERLPVFLLAAALTLPFFLAFEAMVRRGPFATALFTAVAGRLLVIVIAALAVRLELLPFVVSLVLPVLAALFVLFEVFASAASRANANPAVIAVTESLWLAWIVAGALPVG